MTQDAQPGEESGLENHEGSPPSTFSNLLLTA